MTFDGAHPTNSDIAQSPDPSPSSDKETDVLIVGGGLSGLRLAALLAKQGRAFVLLEAAERFGGRIKTELTNTGYFDLGPTWFWPGQPRIDALIQELGLNRFDQHATGDLCFEDERGETQRGIGFSSMQGSFRLVGGMGALTQALADGLPNGMTHLSSRVASLAKTSLGVTATLADGSNVHAQHVVLATPPRLVAATLNFTPALPKAALQVMQDIPTWMAGQAKAVAIYDRPFWRDAGLSGDAMSRRGPMVEIHDASTDDGRAHALFGFIGVPPSGRGNLGLLRHEICAQLGRLFGPEAAEPKELHVKDWVTDPLVATDHDRQPLYAHPTYSLPTAISDLWDGRLIFAGTEVAPQFGGFLEGALEAAENAMAQLAVVNAGQI